MLKRIVTAKRHNNQPNNYIHVITINKTNTPSVTKSERARASESRAFHGYNTVIRPPNVTSMQSRSHRTVTRITRFCYITKNYRATATVTVLDRSKLFAELPRFEITGISKRGSSAKSLDLSFDLSDLISLLYVLSALSCYTF